MNKNLHFVHNKKTIKDKKASQLFNRSIDSKKQSARIINHPRYQVLCVEGRINGATKFRREWAIPVNSDKPIDKCVTTGE